MSAEENKATVRRVYDIISSGNLDAFIQSLSPDYTDHSLPPGLPPGLTGTRLLMAGFLGAFPDLKVTVDDVIAEGDTVVARITSHGTHQGDFQGIPATGRPITITGIEIFHLANGTITERWGELNILGLLQQLGAIPAP